MAENVTALPDIFTRPTFTSQKLCFYISYIGEYFRFTRLFCRDPLDSEHERNMTEASSGHFPENPSTSSPNRLNSYSGKNEDLLEFVVLKVLFPIVMVLIAICVVLGVILVVKTYMMAPIKHNLATAIRRRRRFGHAPENNYVPSEEMCASQRWSIPNSSDRKSLPPPEVLMAARARASQMLHV